MIAANGAIARFLDARGVSSIRRVVKAPERWQRIVALASGRRHLPEDPSSRALSAFLDRRKAAAPETFGDLSLHDREVDGAGRVRARAPGVAARRPLRARGDRLYALDRAEPPVRRPRDPAPREGGPRRTRRARTPTRSSPRSPRAARRRRTTRERSNERRASKRRRVFLGAPDRAGVRRHRDGRGGQGDVRAALTPPAEGRIVQGEAGLDVGDRVRVRSIATEPRKGFIDFARA